MFCYTGIRLLSLTSQYTLIKFKELTGVIVRNCHSVSFRQYVEY
jgi:hypothetical protein